MSAAQKDYTAIPGMTETLAVTEGGPGTMTLVHPAATLPAPTIIETSILSTLLMLARDKDTDVGKLSQLVQLQREERAFGAERAFNAALRRCQTRMTAITVNAQNKQTGSKYADYYTLDAEARPIYTEEGFAVTFSTADAGPESLKVLGWLLHDDGHSRQYEITMPADGKGPKGQDVMSKTHATGAAMTYGKRYLLVDMFNLAIDKDDDGNGAGINDAQVEAIYKLIKDTGTDEKAFCDYFKIPMVADLSRKDYQRAADYLRRKSGVPQTAPDYLK